MTSRPSTSSPLFKGPLAGTGTHSGYKSPHWHLRPCPRCNAVAHERCFRWTSEKTTGYGTEPDGEGRKTYLKHPHPERRREIGEDGRR